MKKSINLESYFKIFKKIINQLSSIVLKCVIFCYTNLNNSRAINIVNNITKQIKDLTPDKIEMYKRMSLII